MTLFERLLFLERDFDVIVEQLQQGGPSRFSFDEALNRNGRIANRFLSISFRSEGNTVLLYGLKGTLPDLTDLEGAHLRQGKAVILSRKERDRKISIYIVKALRPDSLSKGLVYAEISADHIWGIDGSISPLKELIAIDERNNVLFSSIPGFDLILSNLSPLIVNSSSGSFEWSLNKEKYLAEFWTLFMKPQYGTNWVLVHSISQSEVFKPVSNFRTIFLLVAGLTFFVILFLTISQLRKRLVPIEILTEATRKIAAKDFGSRVSIESGDEFTTLGRSFNMMADSLQNHFNVMNTINQIGVTITAEKDSHRTMQQILAGAKSVTNADGYALFMSGEDGHLQLATMIIESLDMVFGSSTAPSLPLFDEDGKPNTRNVTVCSLLENRTVNIPDIYTDTDFDFSDMIRFDTTKNYRTTSLLNVPLQDHEDRTIGVLQLINARSANASEVVPFTIDDQKLIQTLASEAGVALSKNRLIEDMKKLFDALVELVSTAIDEKSPYTGGHSRRVADLVLMIALTIASQEEGPFADITFSEEELYELKIASLLHDCGKVTTPVHVMDKSTRLQAIFDRIQLIDTRFEILKRDIEIQQNPAEHDRGGITADAVNARKYTLKQLEEDRDFIRACNSGERMVSESDKARILDIGNRYRWTTMDGNAEQILTENEIYNLSIRSGTITPEERNIINDHINLTIRMLDSLPYPASLRKIPDIVAAHHERCDGSGYPRGLTRDQILLQGRILAMADVFEALLAGDRPYKKWKTVPEALHILGEMKEKGHIDPDLFELFIREKIYLTYAKKHVPHGNANAVDHSSIPGYESLRQT